MIVTKGASEMGRPVGVHIGDSQELARQKMGNGQKQKPLLGSDFITQSTHSSLPILDFDLTDIKEAEYLAFISHPPQILVCVCVGGLGGGCQALSRRAVGPLECIQNSTTI